MNYFSRDSLTSSSHEKYGWLAIFGLFSFLGLFFLAGAGRFLIFLYPICSFAVGIYLFQYYPRLYILYTFWLWFLSGLIRRLIDYQSGEYTMGGFYTTPEFVTLISSLTFIRLFPKELRSIGLPFILCVGSVVYGTLIGIINNPLTDFSIVDSIFGFLCPIIFGFHLYSYWQEYPTLSRSINNIFINGVLVMGLYGIYQYVVAPAWDRFFLTLTELAARGTPESFGIRVWSTTSAAHQLVFPLIPGILLSLCPPFNWTQYLVLLFGVITLLASVVRTGWLCLLLVVTLYIASKNQNSNPKS
ncbi:MAG: hypothetical protein HC768_01055 [Acaryochloris sp. CRU_2_0]|nr:hypothetical protein [Acaryochloris sp. CRU_2_0]